MIITVANTKGGAGKTVTCYGLFHALADAGERVALLDVDPQRGLAAWVPDHTTAYDPATSEDVASAAGALDAEVVVVDTGPSANGAALAALAAADVVVSPTKLGFGDLRALGQFRRIVEPDFVVPIEMDRRYLAHKEALEVLRDRFGGKVTVAIPRSSAIERAQATGKVFSPLSAPGVAFGLVARQISEQGTGARLAR